MKSSENRMTSASRARARAARARLRLPAMSPITGLSCASAMRKRSTMAVIYVLGASYAKPTSGSESAPARSATDVGRLCKKRLAAGRDAGLRGLHGPGAAGGLFDQRRGTRRRARLFGGHQRVQPGLGGGDKACHSLAQGVAQLQRA